MPLLKGLLKLIKYAAIVDETELPMPPKCICKISLSNYGLTPCDFWIEARSLSKGFSVLVYIQDHTPKPKRLFATKRDFTISQFVKYIRQQSEIVFDDLDAWEFLEVIGAEGLDAISLKFALTGDCYSENDTPLSEWIDNQNKSSKRFIEHNIDLNKLDTLQWLCDLASLAEVVTSSNNLIDLLDKYDLPHSQVSLEKLYSCLTNDAEKIESEQEEKRKAAADKSEAKLAPYKDTIQEIANQFDNVTYHSAGGYARPSKRSVIKRWLERFVLVNDSLPVGAYEVEDSYFGSKISLGTVDFAKIRQSLDLI